MMELDDFTQGTAIAGTNFDVIISGNKCWTDGMSFVEGNGIFGRFSNSWSNARMQVTNNFAPNLFLGGASGNTETNSTTAFPTNWVNKAPDRVASGANRAGRYGWNAGVVANPN